MVKDNIVGSTIKPVLLCESKPFLNYVMSLVRARKINGFFGENIHTNIIPVYASEFILGSNKILANVRFKDTTEGIGLYSNQTNYVFRLSNRNNNSNNNRLFLSILHVNELNNETIFSHWVESCYNES